MANYPLANSGVCNATRTFMQVQWWWARRTTESTILVQIVYFARYSISGDKQRLSFMHLSCHSLHLAAVCLWRQTNHAADSVFVVAVNKIRHYLFKLLIFLRKKTIWIFNQSVFCNAVCRGKYVQETRFQSRVEITQGSHIKLECDEHPNQKVGKSPSLNRFQLPQAK